MSVSYRIELDEEAGRFNVWLNNEKQHIGYLNFWVKSDYLEIADLLLDENYRQQGIGSKLMSLVIGHAKSLGLEKVVLNTAANDLPVHDFYRKNGFEFITEKPSGVVFEQELKNA